ncbi:FIG004851: hypothetical protein [hydrothermal vent metagenome]|uniref:Uncharacterized protein n=1 Tax=hydrothermal vent metagenome TaxID=652676 RepID=A0A3B0TBQ0_9ZZZZ
MIRYDLKCVSDHSFEGWFRDSVGYEAQSAQGALACPVCGSSKIEKALMTPGLPVKANAREGLVPQGGNPVLPSGLGRQDEKAMAFRDAVRALRTQVEANADYVGDRFAEEARRIYYAETESGTDAKTHGDDTSKVKPEGPPEAGKRGIYGEATLEDAKALRDEGIDVLPLPVLPEDQN